MARPRMNTAKRSFKICEHFIYVLSKFNFVKILLENAQEKLLTTLDVLCLTGPVLDHGARA